MSKRVLVIDDEKPIVDMMTQMLERLVCNYTILVKKCKI